MKNLKFSFLFSVLAISSACSLFESNIKEISSIQEVKSIFEQAKRDDLFVFDVDQVILESTEPTMQAKFSNNPKVKKIVDDFNTFTENKKDGGDTFFSKMFLKVKVQPVEQKLIDNILNLQKRNVKIIALTALNTGKFGLIDRLEEWRYKQLLNLGIDLGHSFASKEIIIKGPHDSVSAKNRSDFKTKFGKDPGAAIFYKGIICSSCYKKGIVLKEFLQATRYSPSKIYFFDDKYNNVTSVMKSMAEMGIKCYGFVYKAATVNQPMDGLDIDVAHFQHELMKQRNDDDYISYSEAKEILDQQKMSNKNKLKPIQVIP